MNGMTRQLILEYFRYETEVRRFKKMNLPPLQPVGAEEHFKDLIQSLPDLLRAKISEELERYAIAK